MSAPIAFVASVSSVRTTLDGGIKVTLDIPESNLAEGMALMALRQRILKVSIVAEE
jgi:hypothetical protein